MCIKNLRSHVDFQHYAVQRNLTKLSLETLTTSKYEMSIIQDVKMILNISIATSRRGKILQQTILLHI